MGKSKNLPPTRVKYWEELKEIEEAAKAANCDTNFFIAQRLTAMWISSTCWKKPGNPSKRTA